MMEQNLNLLAVLKTLYKWRRPLIICSVLAFLGSAGISLLLPDYYQARTTFYAASEDQAKPEVLFSEKGSGIKTEYYGSESDIDRIISAAQSNEVKDFLIDSFQLFEHYKMNPDAPKAKFRLRKKLDKYYDIMKNERDALILSFEDKDPEFAAKVANTTRDKVEEQVLRLIRSNQQKNLSANQRNIESKEQYQKVISDSLAALRKTYGIYDGLEQTQELSTQVNTQQAQLSAKKARFSALKEAPNIPKDTLTYLGAEVEALEATVKSYEDKLESWRIGMAAVLDMEKQYFDGAQSLSEDRERTRMLMATFKADVPGVLILEEAEVPLYKSRPSRSILVIAATMIVFFFSVLGVLLFDAYKDLNWRSVIDA